MLALLLVMLGLGLLGLGAGWLVGRGGRSFPQLAAWVLPLSVTLLALAVPSVFLVSRVSEVFLGLEGASEPVRALALRFAALTLGLLAAALAVTFVALWRLPFLAPLVPPALFVTFYGGVLPLAYEVYRRLDAGLPDNTPTIWLFAFCAGASAGLLGYALGQQAVRPPPAAVPSTARTPRR